MSVLSSKTASAVMLRPPSQCIGLTYFNTFQINLMKYGEFKLL